MTKNVVGAVVVCVLLGSLSVLVWALSNNKVVIGYNKGYMPDQPINFPHDIHAGQYKIDCRYCHAGVEVSRHATVPSGNVCMNCHGPALVQKDSPELQKVRDAYNNNRPVAWMKVHLLPDHVKFNHSAHIKAATEGRLVDPSGHKVTGDQVHPDTPAVGACVACHGQVAEMKKVSQVNSLAMGWCVNCHREKENNAPTTCGTCHY